MCMRTVIDLVGRLIQLVSPEGDYGAIWWLQVCKGGGSCCDRYQEGKAKLYQVHVSQLFAKLLLVT